MGPQVMVMVLWIKLKLEIWVMMVVMKAMVAKVMVLVLTVVTVMGVVIVLVDRDLDAASKDMTTISIAGNGAYGIGNEDLVVTCSLLLWTRGLVGEELEGKAPKDNDESL